MTIGERIKEKRLELKLSQDELAKMAGYSDKSAICKFERGGNEITMKQVKRVAKALGVSSAYLMGWENNDITISDMTSDEKLLVMEWRDIDDQSKEMIKRILAYGQKLRGEKDDD